jgi:putative addiction module killer protein
MEIRQTTTYEKWFEALKDRNARMRINIRIRRLASGNPGDVKPVGNGISEIRINYGPGYRVYLIQKGNRIIILLCGGDKSTQSRDIKKAQELMEHLEELK